ncbi:MAG: M48 family metallopeptidase [Bacteroidota bacterium]|nr:M48 family metallopeptidase [Bacteroidota bacterium]
MRSRQTKTSVRWQDIHLPLLIIEEPRYDTRVSIGKTSAYLRMPYAANREYKHEKLIWAKKWLLETLQEKPDLAMRWKNKEYRSGQIIKTAFKNYTLQLSTGKGKATGSAYVDNNDLILSLPHLEDEEFYTRDFITTLISRGISADVHTEFSQRVHAYNKQYYKEDISSIRLKYVHSRWGSCATNGNLNFSSKLLLAPVEIMDSVIIHELAHLKEMNHGDRFWKWVEKGDSEYLQHESWLKKNGDRLDF